MGANDTVMLPRGSTHTDWEVELGVVIGTPCKYVSTEEALDYVAGYFVSNDVSERHFQTKLMANGPAVNPVTLSGQSVRGWSPQMKFQIHKIWIWVWI